jgi:hypothetical protein
MQQTLIRGLNVARISPDTFLEFHRMIPAAISFLAIVSQTGADRSAAERDVLSVRAALVMDEETRITFQYKSSKKD